ncbi:hypothetical protein UG55_11323 [Frankia sp. EI5c]|nr:hypothetical protein UG55_11323 [Frankia sp. EI5c]
MLTPASFTPPLDVAADSRTQVGLPRVAMGRTAADSDLRLYPRAFTGVIVCWGAGNRKVLLSWEDWAC